MKASTPIRGPGRFRDAAPFRALLLLVATAMLLPGCNIKDAREEFILTIRNSEVSENLDSLCAYGINKPGEDTVVILRWVRGEPFPEEVKCPPGLGREFDFLVQGFLGGALIHQSRTAISGGRAGERSLEMVLVAPDLADTLIERSSRIGDTLVLAPIWKQWPGWRKQKFEPQGSFAWKKGGRVLSGDTVLRLSSLAWADSGTYVFRSENAAGRDSMAFHVSMRHRLPGIAPISDRATLAGDSLAVKADLSHSDALDYRWMMGSVLVSEDSVLIIRKIGNAHVGAYHLEVRNASDPEESAVSNTFRILVVGRLSKWDTLKWDRDVWW
jgi:hypothetical protein